MPAGSLLPVTARAAAACVFALAFAAACAAQAGAASAAFCVAGDSPSTCPAGADPRPSIEQAIADSAVAAATTIYVTSGTHLALGSFDLGAKPIRLVGVGPTPPVLTAPASDGAAVVATLSPLAKFDNLAIAIPASTGMTGLRAANGGQAITRVSISGPAAAQSIGVEIGDSNPTLSESEISLDGPDGESTGVKLETATTPVVTGLTISDVNRGIAIDASNNFELRRLKIKAATGLRSRDSNGSVASSLIELPQTSTKAQSGLAVDALSDNMASSTLDVFNCTLVRPGGGGGTGVRSATSGPSATQSVNVDSSIISGFATRAAFAAGSLASPAKLSLRYVRYDGVAASAVAGDLTEGPGTQSSTLDFGFVDPASGDYHLRLDSPMVDRGNPVIGDFTQADSGSDLDDLPRVVARGAGKIRDVGAYEVQNSLPRPAIRIVTSAPSTTTPTEFSAADSSDADGDTLSFEWSFDGVPGAIGVTARKQFLTAGPHTVRLTATDETGASSTITRQFDVATGFLKLSLRSQVARITTKGTFRINLTCPAAAISDCTGRLVMQTAQRIDAKRYTKRPGWSASAKHVKAADYVFRVAPGATRKVEVHTFKTFQNVLAVEKKFKLTGGIVAASTTNAKLTSNRATFTISAPRRAR